MDVVNDGWKDLHCKYINPHLHQIWGGQGGLCEGDARASEAFQDPAVPGPGGQAFIVGNQMFVDCSLLDLLLNHQILDGSCLDSFPLLSAYVACLSGQPKLKAFLASPKHVNLPINGNKKQ